MKFEEVLSCGRRQTVEKVFGSSKVPLIIDRSERNLQCLLCNARKVRDMDLEEEPWSGSRETVEKVLWSPSEVPVIID
jgi:hypothetical protein